MKTKIRSANRVSKNNVATQSAKLPSAPSVGIAFDTVESKKAIFIAPELWNRVCVLTGCLKLMGEDDEDYQAVAEFTELALAEKIARLSNHGTDAGDLLGRLTEAMDAIHAETDKAAALLLMAYDELEPLMVSTKARLDKMRLKGLLYLMPDSAEALNMAVGRLDELHTSLRNEKHRKHCDPALTPAEKGGEA